jgi:hypothetical protein
MDKNFFNVNPFFPAANINDLKNYMEKAFNILTMDINKPEEVSKRLNENFKNIFLDKKLKDYYSKIYSDIFKSFFDDYNEFVEYLTDLFQRYILFADTLRKRANIMLDHYKQGMPPLIHFKYEEVIDARGFESPANYILLKIIPPEGVTIDPKKRPIMIFDPRAGHGPGIGAFKKDSEAGIAMQEGHQCYLVGFFPEPCKNQTLDDVGNALLTFIDVMHDLHPDNPPVIYANCQAGWMVTMIAASKPELTGPIVINGTPISYWAGRDMVNPMRVAGGLTGGVWSNMFLSDLGNGKFDGAWLVLNFEMLNPANTFWKKEFSVFHNIDKEEQRYLDFERWWTGFYFFNEEEIVAIVNNLFIGNKLEKGEMLDPYGNVIDLRNIKEPLIIFASEGDNISPPEQGLQWICEVYNSTEELKKHGQRIIYLIHPNIGHLGIFVSGKVANREHRAIIENIEKIRDLEPGLYQMKIVAETGDKNPEEAQFEVDFIERDIQDIKLDYEKEDFEYVKFISKANKYFYENYVRPFIKPLVTEQSAEIMKWMHPDRFFRVIFSDTINPWMKYFEYAAAYVRENRISPDEKSFFKISEQKFSNNIETFLDSYRELRDNYAEWLFKSLYMNKDANSKSEKTD